MVNSKTVLKTYKLKTTPCREEVLRLFFENDHALSHADIEGHAGQSFDRVTVYRTLKTFVEKGIVHKVLDDDSVTKYALCSECSGELHKHEHVHFKCEQCGQTICLDDVKIPPITLPEGYRTTERNVLFQGVCAQCRA